jgi:diaminopimelate decarboxylase
MLFDLVVEIKERLGVEIEFVNLGGGVGIPYRPEDKEVDVAAVSMSIKDVYDDRVKNAGMPALKVFTELGRYITGPYGYLITRVQHFKDTYKNYVGVDACMADLMRPAMYGAYHHITVLGKEQDERTKTYDVTGSLCENNDKFAIDRELPPLEQGDLLAIHDTGAHGHSMGFNYNGKLRSAELLLKEDGSVEMIRRAETLEDYFATLNF